jgi:hypothetical protein
MSQARVNFSVLVDVRGYHPGTGDVMKVENCAFANVEEEA